MSTPRSHIEEAEEHQLSLSTLALDRGQLTPSPDNITPEKEQWYPLILGNDQLDALFLNVFILCLYMFRATSAHHQEGQIVLIHYLV
jgi:hypothetical protein